MTWPVSNGIAKELDDFWKESDNLWRQWQQQADYDTKMMTGQQENAYNQYGSINYRNNRTLLFNKILRIVNMIDGYQRDNRLGTSIIAADNDPDMGETAEQRTAVLNWSKRQDRTYEKISDSFNGAVTCGLNLLNVWMDFREDPENGMIRTERLPFANFLMDPYWTQADLSDCGRIWTRRYLTQRQLDSIFPKVSKEVPSLNQGYAAKDGKFPFLAQNWYQYQTPMYAYDEYWTRDYKTKRKLLDTKTGEVAPWNGTKEQFQYLLRINPNVKLIKAQVPTVKLNVLVNNHLMYEEQSPYGLDRFPFVPFLCYHFPEVQNYSFRYQGVVRNVVDSQIELNRRRNRLLDVLDAQVQSGIMVKEDALVNPEDAFFQGPGKVMYFKNSANLASDVVQIPPPPVAPGWMELIQTIEKEIMDIVGPEELFAQNLGAKEMSGVLMKLKMGAGLTGLRNIFDRLNLSQMLVGEIFDALIVENFGEGKVAHILGKQPSEHFFEKEFSKFNCVVEEMELTASQRQLQFLQAIQMKQLGIPIPNKYLLEKSTLSDKKGVIESIVQEEQQQAQIQQAQMQQQLEQQEIVTRSIEAKAQNDFAAAQERRARSVSDLALAKHHEGESVANRASAALNNAKAMKELEELDENRLMKLADFILSVQERQKIMNQGEEDDSINEAMALSVPVEKSKMQSELSKNKQEALV